MSERVTIQPATLSDAAGIARVHVDAWRTTYPGNVPAEYLARLSYESRERLWQRVLRDQVDRSIVLVAEIAGEIVGFACVQLAPVDEEPADGDLTTIYLLQQWQERGIGSRLVLEITRRLIAAGQRSLVVWVAAANTSGRRFYEALGGQLAERRQVSFGELTLDEVSYRWPDIATLERTLAARR